MMLSQRLIHRPIYINHKVVFNMLNIKSMCCSFCLPYFDQHHLIHTTKINNSDKKRKRGITYDKIRQETIKRNMPFIEIWKGMTIKDLSRATNKSQNELREAMRICKLKNIDDFHDIPKLAKLIKFRVRDKTNILSEVENDEDDTIDYGPMKVGSKLERRPPVVTIMGHVDHGKTTLLDSLRKSEIVSQEHGGITQHIGAFVVHLSEEKKKEDVVTFLDTPGHAAFSLMRQRGANATDIVVLVVAADDGVMEQTIESIKYANNAKVPIIVAINKIDKINVNNNMEYLKRGLLAQGIILEEDGGEIQAVKISALKGTGLTELKEAILALAETLQLRDYTDSGVEGIVIESCIDAHRGKLATILVQKGTLKKGDVIWAGQESWAKVRSMFDEWGNVTHECPPAYPVQVIGWKDDKLPSAGDSVRQLENEKRAHQIMSKIIRKERHKLVEVASKETEERMQQHLETYKAELEARRALGIKYKSKKLKGPRTKENKDEDEDKINIIAKCDVYGSLEVLLNIINSYPNHKSPIKLNLIHHGVGAITENDVELATCFNNCIIYAFNIGTQSLKVSTLAKDLNVKIKKYNVIYHLVDNLKEEISEMLPLLDQEVISGEALVIQEFVINEKTKKIPVAGAKCSKGVLKKDLLFKIKRGDQFIATDLKITSMKHFKNEVKEIKNGFECGLRFEGIVGTEGLRFEPSDLIVCYEIKKIKQTTKWSPPGFT